MSSREITVWLEGKELSLEKQLRVREEVAQDGDGVYSPSVIPRDILALENQSVREILNVFPENTDVFFTHPEMDERVWLSHLDALTASSREDFSLLLDATVGEIHPTEDGFAFALNGVPAAELERFRETFEAHMQAEEEMGLMM